MAETLESILVVYQNPAAGRQAEYDEWYTNIHIRDAMRIEGAIATQRFALGEEQPVLRDERVTPRFWAHTIYEWESAEKSVRGHHERAGTPLMEITRDCAFKGLRDYFYRPEYLSHGWTPQAGFRRGVEILTAMILPPAAGRSTFVKWFQEKHAPDTLALDGFGSVGLFSLHEAQSLPHPAEYSMVAIYGLADRPAALRGWARRHDANSELSLDSKAARVEIGCWQPRIPRLQAREVLNATPEAALRERRAREKYAGNYLTKDEIERALVVG